MPQGCLVFWTDPQDEESVRGLLSTMEFLKRKATVLSKRPRRIPRWPFEKGLLAAKSQRSDDLLITFLGISLDEFQKLAALGH